MDDQRRPAGIDRTDLVGYGPKRPRMRMALTVPRAIMHSVGAVSPETGGILIGPIDSDDITEFHLDCGGRWTGATYSPDHATLNTRLREDWKPRGLDFKGFVHSHPDGYVDLSQGDLVYIRRIFACNHAMTAFMAPIVIPALFWLRPFIVYRGHRLVVSEATLEVFDPDLNSKEGSA